MGQVIGQRTTSQANTESRIVREVGAEIGLLEPNEAPLITLFSKMNKRKSIPVQKSEWYEDDFSLRWAVNGAATVNANAASTTITVADGTLFVAGDQAVIPGPATSSTAPEVIRITTVVGNVLTVIRDIGTSGNLVTLNASGGLRIIGNAYEEGALPPTAKTTAPTLRSNFLQIFRHTIDFSKSGAAIKQYGVAGSERERQTKKKMLEHKIALNSALLFGKASQSFNGGPTSKPIGTTDGLFNVIQSNVTDGGGVLTQKTFEAFSRQAFRYGKRPKVLLAAPKIKSAINEWGKSYLQVRPTDTMWGVSVQRITTAHGEWMLVNDWMLEDGVAGQNGFASNALSLDMEEFTYRFLSNNGINRDTHLSQDIVKDGRDAFTDEVLTECGFDIKQEKWHARLFNVTDYAL